VGEGKRARFVVGIHPQTFIEWVSWAHFPNTYGEGVGYATRTEHARSGSVTLTVYDAAYLDVLENMYDIDGKGLYVDTDKAWLCTIKALPLNNGQSMVLVAYDAIEGESTFDKALAAMLAEAPIVFKPLGRPIEPPKDAGSDAWFEWYHEMLDRGFVTTLEYVAEQVNRSAGYIRTKHAEWKQEHRPDLAQT
jgi:hypothetical protein